MPDFMSRPERFIVVTIRDNALRTAAWADTLEAAIAFLKKMKANHESCCLIDLGEHRAAVPSVIIGGRAGHQYDFTRIAPRLAEFLVIQHNFSDADAKEMMLRWMQGEMR